MKPSRPNRFFSRWNRGDDSGSSRILRAGESNSHPDLPSYRYTPVVDSSSVDPAVPDPTPGARAGSRAPRGIARLAWVPIPLILAALFLLGPVPVSSSAHRYLTPLCNFLFTTLGGILVAVLAARAYIEGGPRGVLLLGSAGFAFGLVNALTGLSLPGGRFDAAVTIHNIGACFAAIFNVGGALLLLSPSRRPASKNPALVVVLAYGSILLGTLLILRAATSHLTPEFFVQGQGPTATRNLVLGTAIVGHAAAAVVLLAVSRRLGSVFLYWYALGLGLTTIGLLGVFHISDLGSLQAWLGRAAQYLGSVYLIVASLHAVRHAHAWTISIGVLRETHQRYTSLVEFCPDAILVHVDGRYVFANPAALRIFGVSNPRDLIGQRVLDLVHPEDRESVAKRIHSLPESGAPNPLRETRILRLDGRAVDVEASADLAEWEGRQGVQVVLRDVTERKLAAQRKEQAELRLRRAAAQRLRLAQVSTTVVAQTSVEGLLSEVATAARDLISARWAVSSLGESAESLRLGAVATASGVEERDASILFRPDADGIACRAKLLRARSCRLQCAVTEGRSDADAGGNEPARTGGDAAATTGGDGSSTTGPPAPATREVVAARLESANGSVRGLLVACGKFEGEDEAAPDPGGMTEEDESLLVQLASIASLALQHIEARSEAERAGRMKDEFLATLSHELRTPLSVILGWAQMLSSGRLHDDEAREAIRTIERNACNQKELIEELLDMSRIISGKVHLDLQLVDPSEVALQAAASILPSIEAKGLRLTQSIDPAAGRVFGDPDRLQQVLGNLLTNAVKFTPEGGEVRLDVFAQNDQVCFVVSDSGVGIRQESLLAIFERFRQQDSSTTRKYKGLGLGLSIAKQLVALQEGTIEAWSEGEGKGATFTVRMQRVAPEGERPAPRTESSREPSDEQLEAASRSLAGIRVLVVEDEMEAARLIALWMREAGAEAHMASSVAAALDLLVSGRYDLIVSDIGMPDQDGYDLIRAVRSSSDAAIARIPAVALTAFARHEDRERARKAGFQHHLAKPVDPQELLAIAARLCDAAKPARPSQRSIA